MTQRNQIIIGIVAAVAALAAYWMLLLSPKRDEAAKLSKEIASQQQQLDQARSQLASYQQAKSAYKANYATVARLGKAVPEEDDVRSLVVQIDAAARRTNVDFRTMQVSDTAAAAPEVGSAAFVTMPFSFDFEGRFFRLSDFMSHLERFVAVRNHRIDVTGRLLVLDSLELTPAAEGWPRIQAKIGATSYTLPPTQGLTAGATAAAPSATTAPASAAAAAGGSAAPKTTAIVTSGAK